MRSIERTNEDGSSVGDEKTSRVVAFDRERRFRSFRFPGAGATSESFTHQGREARKKKGKGGVVVRFAGNDGTDWVNLSIRRDAQVFDNNFK